MSKHKITATCPFAYEGVEVEIAFSFTPGAGPTGPTYASGGEPGYPAEVELVSVKPIDPAMALPANLQADLDDWADDWLDDEGRALACDRVAEDDEAAREYAAELRADR